MAVCGTHLWKQYRTRGSAQFQMSSLCFSWTLVARILIFERGLFGLSGEGRQGNGSSRPGSEVKEISMRVSSRLWAEWSGVCAGRETSFRISDLFRLKRNKVKRNEGTGVVT